jgi:hypothetical protein
MRLPELVRMAPLHASLTKVQIRLHQIVVELRLFIGQHHEALKKP